MGQLAPTETKPLTVDAVGEELTAGKVLVVGLGVKDAARELVSRPGPLQGLRVHVNPKLEPDAWELY